MFSMKLLASPMGGDTNWLAIFALLAVFVLLIAAAFASFIALILKRGRGETNGAERHRRGFPVVVGQKKDEKPNNDPGAIY